MKNSKILLSTLSVAMFAFMLSACGNATTNNSAGNVVNKSNTAIVVNTNQTNAIINSNSDKPANNAANAITTNKPANAAAPESKDSGENIQGELQTGKTESVILYVGEETGDYAAYCFTNDSEAGRAILAACKDRGQCEVTGTTGEGACKVPGLEASLSASAKILKVNSVKPLSRKK